MLPEPWYWSFAPVSLQAQGTLTPVWVPEAFAATDLPGLLRLLVRIEDLFASLILATAPTRDAAVLRA